MLAGLVGLALLASGAHGQTNPLIGQFNRLMGEPKQLAGILLDYPWRAELPAELPGLRAVEPASKIRIGSVELPLSGLATWKRWESEDGNAWVDVVHFNQSGRATEMIQSARQTHSGYIWANQLLLFSGTGDRQKEALGAAVATGSGALLNVGVRLPVEVAELPHRGNADRCFVRDAHVEQSADGILPSQPERDDPALPRVAASYGCRVDNVCLAFSGRLDDGDHPCAI